MAAGRPRRPWSAREATPEALAAARHATVELVGLRPIKSTLDGWRRSRVAAQDISQASVSNITTVTVTTVSVSATRRVPKATFPRCAV